MKPFRSGIDLTIAAPDLGIATKKWDELTACAEDLGFNLEGGFVSEMKPEEVIPGSPIDRKTEAA